MMGELRCASLCLLLAGAHAASAGNGAPAAAASAAAPVTPPAAVPDLPGPGPSVTPPPPRTAPPPGAPEGPGSVAAEQAAAAEENPDWAVPKSNLAQAVLQLGDVATACRLAAQVSGRDLALVAGDRAYIRQQARCL